MSNNELKELHKKIIEIAEYIDNLCKENDIKYYLSGGCALGAVRHNGFIPWDDDLDIFMTSENYYKFIKVCEKNLDTERFYLQKENTDEWPLFFSKLRLNGTTYIESYNENLKMHKGIFVDLYRLDNISDNYFFGFFQYFCSKLVIARRLPKINYTANNSRKRVLIKMLSLLPSSFDTFLIRQVRKYNSEKCNKVANLFHRGSFRSNLYSNEWLGNPRYVSFESTRLPVPENVEKILETRFGDYMTIPDKNKRKKLPHVKYFNINKDYRFYHSKKNKL